MPLATPRNKFRGDPGRAGEVKCSYSCRKAHFTRRSLISRPKDTSRSAPAEHLVLLRITAVYCCIITKGRRATSFCYGGKTGIRTLEAVLALTRFPVVRLRPTQPSFHSLAALAFIQVRKHYITRHRQMSSVFLNIFIFFCTK